MSNILNEISDCVVNMEDYRIEKLVLIALNRNISVNDIYSKGLNDGMKRVVDLYDKKKYYVPETIVCADTLYKGINIIQRKTKSSFNSKGKILISVVEGDTHDIGKNIVSIMLEAAGYDVLDLGCNVKLDTIIEKAIENNVDIIALSSMMTTTMKGMEYIINKLEDMDIQKRPLVIIGGAPVSQTYANKICADGYSSNAPEAVKLVDKLLA